MKYFNSPEKLTKIILYVMFAVALITGLNAFIGGVAAIPGYQGSVDATVDNEIRFFAVFWIGFGIFCLSTARALDINRRFIPYIALLFFLSGVGRLVSLILIGRPAFPLIAVMVLELTVPVFIFVLHFKSKKLHATANPELRPLKH